MDLVKNIKRIINEVNKCVESKQIYTALTLALSLPDACGSLEWPELSGKGHVGERYKKWFDKNVIYYLSPLSIYDKDCPPILTGEECYKLRCSVLHNGETNISKELNIDYYRIDLETNRLGGPEFRRGNTVEVENNEWVVKQYFFIKAFVLIKSIVDAAESFINNKISRKT